MPFPPQAMRFGVASEQFDQEKDPPGTHRQVDKVRKAGEPYADKSIGGSPQGNRDTEASLRYEDHARLRMKARRENIYPKGAKVGMEDDLSTATPEFMQWREQEIRQQLIATCDTHATDHSTILTNPMHAEKVLAYDVAVGVSHISEKAMRNLRVIADWRLLEDVGQEKSSKIFFEYFSSGRFTKLPLLEWVQSHGSTGAMPVEIVDERTYQRTQDAN